jgi:hypothetical protein
MVRRHCILVSAVSLVLVAGVGCRSERNGGDPNLAERSDAPYSLPADPDDGFDPNWDNHHGDQASTRLVDRRPIPPALRKRFIALREKVERSANYLARHGERALPEFSDPNSRWGRSPYTFVWTIQGVCLAHPINPKLVGKNLMGLTDTHGNNFAVEFARIAASKENNYRGWCDYWWNPPGSDASQHKVSFILRVPGRTWLVGAGLYVDDLTAERVSHSLEQADTEGER